MRMQKTVSNEPPREDQDSDLVRIFEQRIRRAENDSAEWRRQAVEYYRTYGGDPWPQGVKDAMEGAGKPATNFNYALSQVNAVLGQDIADRKEASYQADYDDKGTFGAEAMTRVVRKLYNKFKCHREEVESYQDQLVTGIGWSHAILETMQFPILPKVEAVDAREMYWDSDAKKNNFRDARWVARKRKWYLEDAIAAFPEKAAELKKLATKGGTNQGPDAVLPRKANATGFKERDTPNDPGAMLDEDHVYLWDYEFTKPVPYVVYADPKSGKTLQVARDQYLTIKKGLLEERDEAGVPLYKEIQSADIVLRRVFKAILAKGNEGFAQVIREPEELEIGRFTYQAATGYRTKAEDGRTCFFGLMSLIYEPQLWIAKAISSSIEHIGRSPKGGGGFFDPKMFERPDEFIAKGGQMGMWHPVKSGFEKDKHVIEREQPNFPQAYEKVLDIATSVMPQLTTISDYFKGNATGERSNVLVTNLQGQTMMVLNPLLDPMNELRILNATNIALLVQRHMARDVFNKMCGPMEMEDVTFTYQRDPATGAILRDQQMNQVKTPIPLEGETETDPATGQEMPVPITPYDIVAELDLDNVDVQIELGPASTTQKQAISNALNQTALGKTIMETFPEAGALIARLFLKNMPGLPSEQGKELADQFDAMIEQKQDAGTIESVVKAFQTLPPDQIQQAMMFGQQVLMAQMQSMNPAGAAPPPPAQ